MTNRQLLLIVIVGALLMAGAGLAGWLNLKLRSTDGINQSRSATSDPVTASEPPLMKTSDPKSPPDPFPPKVVTTPPPPDASPPDSASGYGKRGGRKGQEPPPETPPK